MLIYPILRKEVLITPEEGQSKIYGQQDPKLKFLYTGNVPSEIPGFGGALTREQGENVGEYTIKLGNLKLENNGSFKANNYSIVFDSQIKIFTINKKNIPVQWGATTSFVYNGGSQAPTASAISGVAGETLNIIRTTGINVGNYTSTASLSSVTGGQGRTTNYTLTGNTKAFTIIRANPPAIGLTPTSLTFTYGDTSKTVSVTRAGDGLVSASSNNTGVATVSVSGTTITVTPYNAGTATITVAVGIGTNYNAPANKTFTVTVNRKRISVPVGTNRTYNGTTQIGLVANTEYIVGGTASAINAGTYTATATPTSNYAWTDGSITAKNITWNIFQKSIATSWGTTASFVYNGGSQAPTASAASGVAGETLNITRTTGINAGNYTSIASISSVTGGQGRTTNYALTGNTKAFTINAKTIPVQWGATTSFVYNGGLQAPTASAASGVTGETLNITRTTGINAGNYTSIASISSVTGGQGRTTNYTLTGNTRAFIINVKIISVQWETTTSFVYNGGPQAPTASAASGVAGETLNITRTTGTDVGNYTSIASISSVTGGQGRTTNYALTGNTKAFIIKQGVVLLEGVELYIGHMRSAR